MEERKRERERERVLRVSLISPCFAIIEFVRNLSGRRRTDTRKSVRLSSQENRNEASNAILRRSRLIGAEKRRGGRWTEVERDTAVRKWEDVSLLRSEKKYEGNSINRDSRQRTPALSIKVRGKVWR